MHNVGTLSENSYFLPGNHVPNPASPLRVVECGEGNTSQAASLAGMIYCITFSVS